MDRTDVWGRAFVAALPVYGEERAAGVADRAVKAFEERFPVVVTPEGKKVAEAITPAMTAAIK